MNEIADLPGTEGVRFLILKRKAEKHVKKANEINPNATIFEKKLNIPQNIENKIMKLSSSPPEGKGVSVPRSEPSGGGDENSQTENPHGKS